MKSKNSILRKPAVQTLLSSLLCILLALSMLFAFACLG